MAERIVVGMSGGVDSSVAAYLLKKEGYDVVGATVRLWGETDDGTAVPGASGSPSGSKDGAAANTDDEALARACSPDFTAAASADAAAVCRVLGIPHREIRFDAPFRREVVDHFVSEYLRGRTPNPCVVCNRMVKWEALLALMKETDASLVATGHYARIERCANGRLALRRSAYSAKDQTYALYRLTQEQLARTRMVLGEMDKGRVREIAREAGLPVADKPDSQEICFIPDNDYAGFIRRTLHTDTPEDGNDTHMLHEDAPDGGNGSRTSGTLFTEGGKETPARREADPAADGNSTGALSPGNFVAADGTVLGRHKGLIHYTVGQRKGLGLSMGHPVFVTEIRPETNEVVIGEAEDVFGGSLVCDTLCFMGMEPQPAGRSFSATAKIRYAHAGAACRVTMLEHDRARVDFPEPVRAITPGQAVVFYDGDLVLGGGTILRS